jgi:hypothetical protein
MTTYASPTHPLGPPSLNGTEITIDFALENPTRITRTLEDLTLQKFLVDKVFRNEGGVTGGAVLYDVLEENELYLTRDVEPIEPGGVYPIVDGDRRAPAIAPVEKWGGKVFYLDESKRRNKTGLFASKITKLGNTMVRRVNTNTMAVLNAAVAKYGRTMVANDWTKIVTAGTSASTAQKYPLADIAAAVAQSEREELDIVFNLLIMNPTEWANGVTLHGSTGGFKAILEDLGFTWFVTNRQPAGKVKVVAEQEVGGYNVEQPITTITYRDEDHDKTWIKSSVLPVEYVDNPFGILELTGLEG